MIGRLRRALAGLRESIKHAATGFKARALAGVALALAVLGQTTTTDMTSIINQMLPIIMSLFALLIPLIFLMKIFDVIERVFRSFT
ncbi:hypothetical protein APE_0728a [Aeropyrum pernix ovoid virus 1]|uniref:Uncharacterized protein n=2 Tax=root TaxID=1 RepID=Q05E53_AERPE|nr:hypothetical protein [Aeropyrum pernix]YP_009177663.1 hypothetical protein ASQ65_gp12 [Aeropyrum pernix ovoid virus 1]BAF34748.1 hypothetical protein APE_0728a [Aeropyrum pernix ovoid virus 1] [Aeropyrum pernix K1]CCD22153.1 TPA: hypothetical protein [Aeropyrum pernix ovoid virus 1]